MDYSIEEKWGFPLTELYRLAFTFYKQNTGKAIHLSYEDTMKLVAYKHQATMGTFDPKRAPALGVFDVIGRDRRTHWQLLGNITREQAMEGFIDLLDSMCKAFRPYIEAVKQNRDDALKGDLRRMEEENFIKEKRELEQQELLEEGYKEEKQRRQLQDALNKQTYQQFKIYAEKQFPGNPEQQAVLINQLQKEHYHQYMRQLHMHKESRFVCNETATRTFDAMSASEATNVSTTTVNYDNNNKSNANINSVFAVGKSNAETTTKDLVSAMQGLHVVMTEVFSEQTTKGEQRLNEIRHQTDYIDEQEQQEQCQIKKIDKDDDYVLIRPAKIWTRPDIVQFKTEVSSGDGDGVITIGHGDTITVRVPTNKNGKCIFWEFATDSFDIGFGIYFEWTKPRTNEVTVHVSDSDEDEDYIDEDYMSTYEDLESGSLTQDRNAFCNNTTPNIKPPISIIVPIYRRECFNEVYVGSHPYPGEGIYLLKFDNSYSIWRSKTLYYRVYYER